MLALGASRTLQVSVASSVSEYPSSTDKVAANDGLLTEILTRLPARSLMRFKSVSKHWLSLIIDQFFVLRRNPDSSSVSGLLLHASWTSIVPELDFIPLINEGNPTDDARSGSLTFFPGLSGVRILSSCHGLLCCLGHCGNEPNPSYLILNPTTKQFRMLPELLYTGSEGLSIVFDPSRSPHYKVVCVLTTWTRVSPFQSVSYYRIEIYSSETGSWRASGEPFTIENDHGNMQFHAGVYWNGAINWFSTWGDSLYFNVDEERLGTMPMLPAPEGNWNEREFRHYGESRGHLHLVEIYGPVTHFNVYEMERDYSGWFVKYRVDLDGVGIAFPEMMERRSGDEENYSFTILSLVRLEKDESFLVLHTPGKIIHYSLGDGSFRKICDVAREYLDNQGVIEVSLRYFWFHSYDYIESIACI